MVTRLLVALLVLAAPSAAQTQKLVPQDTQAYDQFGAAISLWGPRLAVGAHFADGSDFNTGAVYVWRLEPSGWILESKLTAPGETINEQFGYAVALQDQTLVVGTQTSEGGAAELKGSARVFRRDGTRWTQEALLSPPAIASLSRFGWDVALDGELAVVGAPTHPVAFELSGAAWIFRRDGSGWAQEAMLVPHDPHEEQLFGHDVALSGPLAAVAGVWDGTLAWQSGAVYLFRRGAGGRWTESAKLQPHDLSGNDEFGAAIALDRGRLAVGAPGDDDDGNASGAVYLYHQGAEGWSFQQKLTATDAGDDEHFGQDVALSGDTLAVGAIDPDGQVPWGGAVHVFRWDGTHWRAQAKLEPPGLVPAGYFGSSVTVDGRRVAGGAHLDSAAADQAGSAYVFGPVPTAEEPIAAVR